MKTLYITDDCPHAAIQIARSQPGQEDAALTASPTHDSQGREAYLVQNVITGKKFFVIKKG